MSPCELAVVIPTHNRVDLLPETLASVLREASVDLRVIVVDDDSHDGTEEWLRAVDDPRVEHLVLRPGRLGSGARNAGFERVDSPYVVFLDDDDVLRPGALRRMLDELRDHPDCARVVGAHEVFGAGLARRRGLHPRASRTVVESWPAELFIWNMPPGAMIWRTEVVREIGGWTEGLQRAEDAELCLRAWRHPVRVIPDVVLDYRVHADQAPVSVTWPRDAVARRHFVDQLDGVMRSRAESLLASRERAELALESYLDRDYRAAARGFAALAIDHPDLTRSPLSGPWIRGYLAKSLGGAAAPGSLVRRVSERRRRRRGPVPDLRRAARPDVP